MLRVILVDDERCVLEELEFLLKDKVEIVGKFTNPIKTMESIAELAPEVVFLDVEMPGLSGLEMAEKISAILPQTTFLFVTAYNQYAVDAFELNAVDYLVKPVQPDRLDKALERIVRRLAEGRRDETIHRLGQPSESSPQTVKLWSGRHLAIVPLDRIACCYLAKGSRKVSVAADGQVYQAAEGLTQFVQKLGLRHFLRCHRSYYINPGSIIGLEPGKDDILYARISGYAERIPISRHYRKDVMRVLKENLLSNSPYLAHQNPHLAQTV